MRDGHFVFDIDQHWYGADSLSYRTVHSVNSALDFAPIFHAETIAGKIKAFNWSAKEIIGADTVAGNGYKDFELKLTEPNFNWNLDIETFEMLPLADGKTFAINFYDAGIGTPNYINYKVIGSKVIALFDNTHTDCWRVLTKGKAPDGSVYTQIFWIS